MSQPKSSRAQRSGEFQFIAWLTRWLERQGTCGQVVVGAGDDCAIVEIAGRRVFVTTDCLIEGTHFKRDWVSGAELGRRAFRVSASDLAAMGAAPSLALLSLEVPPRTAQSYLRSIFKGFASACRRCQTDLVGGNLTAAPALGVTSFLLGSAPTLPVGRNRARPGDLLVVSGTLGDAAAGIALLKAHRRQELSSRSARRLVHRWLDPPDRLELGRGLARRGAARSMIDISDGLLQDLSHICRASRVGAVVETGRIPISAALRREFGSEAIAYALRGGEDYELLFSTPAHMLPTVHALARGLRCEVTEIGRLTRKSSLELLGPSGRRSIPKGSLGFDHLERR